MKFFAASWLVGNEALGHQEPVCGIASGGPPAQRREPSDEWLGGGGEVDEVKKAKNRNKSTIRSRVKHVFAVVKRLWRFSKVRYRGLAKNATRAFVTLGLANIYLARRALLDQVRP